MIRILGIDPGSRITGYGIVEMRGNQAVNVANGCIHIAGASLADKLRQIHLAMQQLVDEFEPHEAAIESVFVHRNADSALKLGQARGSAIAALALQGLDVFEYSPAVIKKSVVGRGNAAKEQVQHMIRAILGVRTTLQADAADALAVALCHAHSRNLPAPMTQLRRSRRRWK